MTVRSASLGASALFAALLASANAGRAEELVPREIPHSHLHRVAKVQVENRRLVLVSHLENKLERRLWPSGEVLSSVDLDVCDFHDKSFDVWIGRDQSVAAPEPNLVLSDGGTLESSRLTVRAWRVVDGELVFQRNLGVSASQEYPSWHVSSRAAAYLYTEPRGPDGGGESESGIVVQRLGLTPAGYQHYPEAAVIGVEQWGSATILPYAKFVLNRVIEDHRRGVRRGELWNARTGELAVRYRTPDAPNTSLRAISPELGYFISSDAARTDLRRLADGSIISSFPFGTEQLASASFSASGRTALLAIRASKEAPVTSVRAWDVWTRSWDRDLDRPGLRPSLGSWQSE